MSAQQITEPPNVDPLVLRVQSSSQILQLQPDSLQIARKMPSTPTPVIDIDPNPSSGFEALFMAGLQQVKSIPEEFLRQTPAETISVSDLLVTDLPQSLQSVLRLPETCLSKQTSSWILKCVWRTRVPPREWLSSFDITLDRGWPAGSIQSRSQPVQRTYDFPSGMKIYGWKWQRR